MSAEPTSTSNDEIEQRVRVRMRAFGVALDRAIQQFPGGVEAVAAHLGSSPKRVQKEIDALGREQPGGPKFGVEDMAKVLKLLDDTALLQLLYGDAGQVVRLPPPTSSSTDPAEHVAEVSKAIGMLTALLCRTDWSRQFPALLRTYAELLAVAHRLVDTPQPSANEVTSLCFAHMAFHQALMPFAAYGPTQPLVIQAAADLKRACDLVAERLPEWAKTVK